MHAHELADLAALAAVHARQLIAADAATMDHALATYWKASRCRLDRWCHSLALLTKDSDPHEWSPSEVAAIEEILVSEILARLVTAIAVAHDKKHATNESAPVARNILSAHIDVKRRAIAIVVAPHRNADQADDFLAFRRQVERWSDLLLAYLTPYAAVEEFAADPARVGDFAFDAREHLRSGKSSDMAVTMITAGLRSSFAPLGEPDTPNADLNHEIATAIVEAFAPEFFDSHGQLRSTWLERIADVPNESPLTADNWWHLPSHAPHDPPGPTHWRR
jgi:hypothetical protein